MESSVSYAKEGEDSMKWRALFPLAVLILAIVLMIVLRGLIIRTYLFPVIVGIPLVVFAAAQAAREFLSKPGKPKKAPSESGNARAARLASINAVVWIAALVVGLYLLGFMVGLPLFLLLYIKFHGSRWLTAAISAAGILALLWVINTPLDMRFPPGLLLSPFVQ